MSLVPVPQQDRSSAWTGGYSVVCIASIAGFAAAVVFLAFPEIDLGFSRMFYLGDRHFLFGRSGLGADGRDLFEVLFLLACLGAVAGFIAAAFFDRKPMGVSFLVWAYIALCAIIGPGIVANLMFKDHWGRARPTQIVEFGGTKRFTPPLLRTDQCDRNCSFISGEASNIFILGYAAAFLAAPARRSQIMLAAIAAGSFAGLIRVGGGGHFLSDVIFAGIFMLLIARGLAWLMLERYAPHLADGSPFHQATLRMGRKSAFRTLQLWNRSRRYWRQKQPLRAAGRILRRD
jgi:lipid A 4'-phosphatase